MTGTSPVPRHCTAKLRTSFLTLAICATVLSAAPFRRLPLVVYNGSPSAPEGLYLISTDRPRTGDLVLAWAPKKARLLAAQRGYLPIAVPLLKYVAAGGGDHVCARGRFLSINDHVVALRLPFDGSGRPLAAWTGCRVLGEGEVLLINSSSQSFDGRYFGVSRRKDLIATATALSPF